MSPTPITGATAPATRPAATPVAARPVGVSAAPDLAPASAGAVAADAASNRRAAAAELQDALASARQAVQQSSSSNLEFSVDEQLGRTIVRLVDANTQELIRQIPSEEFLRSARSIDMLRGLLLRQEV